MTKEEAIDILKNRDEGMSLHKVELAIEYAIEALSSPEICKESLQVQETCKENQDSFTSLEEAAEEYTQRMLESWRFDSTGCRPPREAFIAGAEWQKEQMMKEAVDGEVVKDISNKLAVTAKITLDGFKFGDKVKIIIVKEDDNR